MSSQPVEGSAQIPSLCALCQQAKVQAQTQTCSRAADLGSRGGRGCPKRHASRVVGPAGICCRWPDSLTRNGYFSSPRIDFYASFPSIHSFIHPSIHPSAYRLPRWFRLVLPPLPVSRAIVRHGAAILSLHQVEIPGASSKPTTLERLDLVSSHRVQPSSILASTVSPQSRTQTHARPPRPGPCST